MATVAGELIVELRGRNVGLTELLARVTTESQRGGDAAIRLAQQYARVAAAQGQPAAGARLLAAALQNTTGVSERAAAAAQAQIATLQRGIPIAQSFGSAVSSSFSAMIGPLALITAGFGALKTAMDLTKEGFALKVNLDATKRAIDAQLVSVRDSGPVWAEAAAFAEKYKLTQAEMSATLQTSISIMRLSTASTTDLLTTLARLNVLAPEKTISEASRALRELAAGDVVSIKELFNISARDAQKMKREIIAGGDAVGVLSKFLDGVGIGMDALATKTVGAKGALLDLAKAQEDLKLALGGEAGGAGLEIVKTKIELITGLTRLLSGEVGHAGDATQATILASATSYDAYAAGVANANAQLKAGFANDPFRAALIGQLEGLNTLTPAQFAYAQSLIQTGVAQGVAVTQAQAMGSSLTVLGNLQLFATQKSAEMGATFSTLTPLMQQLAAAGPEAQAEMFALAEAFLRGQIDADAFRARLEQLRVAHLGAADAAQVEAARLAHRQGEINAGTSATIDYNTALVDQAQKSIAAAQETQKLAQFQADLTSLSGAVVNGTTSAGNAAIAMANKYNIATDAARALIDAQAALGQAAVNAKALQDQRAGERSGGSVHSFDDLTRSSDIARKKAQELAAANRAATIATGSHAQKLALVRSELAKLVPGTADYIKKQTELTVLQQSGAKGAKGGAGGGSVKLSDQQKLNNTLLADQEKFGDKVEDAERDHLSKLLDIERDYARKSLEQQRANEVSKRTSRFSFYSSLSSAAKDLGNEEAQQYSAAYEAAFAESQKLAAEGHKKEAADLLALRQRQIQDDIEAAKAVRAAKEANDTAEVERLASLEALRKDAQREELEQLKAAGDPNVNARQAAIDEEQARFGEAQDKIGLSAERSAERKVTAAERAGKAIDAEKLKLGELATAYDKVAPARGVAPVGGSPPIGASTAATATPTAPVDLAALLAALQAKLDEVKGAIGETTAAARDTAGAVRSVGGLVH